MSRTNYLDLLQDHIDISDTPFSDRGSRLLLFRYSDKYGLFIKLAERLSHLDADNEGYLHRPPFVQDLVLIDSKKNELDFSVTSNPYQLLLHTRIGDFEIVFDDQETLVFKFPDHETSGLKFKVYPQHWQSSNQGGKLVSVRNLRYETSGEMITNQITPVDGGYAVELLVNSKSDCSTTIKIFSEEPKNSVTLPFSTYRNAAKTRWVGWFDQVPEVHAKYQKTYAYAWWVMANNLISPRGNILFEAMAPSKVGYVGLWLWDNAMHAIAFKHVNAEMARNQIRSMLAYQLPNGMLPDAIFDDGIVYTIDHPIYGEVTKPPILAWAALKLHESNPDEKFISEIYPPLVKWNNWWFAENDDDHDGLVQYNHPYSSGLDDSPLWDEGMPVESPELNTYLYLDMLALARMAEILHLKEEAENWRNRADLLIDRIIEHFWDAEKGIFWVKKSHRPVNVITPFNLYPLWTAKLPEEMKDRLVNHMVNPALFWGRYMIPTVARNDPQYDPQTMWRGPVWLNINYFFIEALTKVGEFDFANQLRENTLEMVMAQDGIFEYYDAETGIPPDRAVRNFGWSAAVFIDLAIQARNESLKKPKP